MQTFILVGKYSPDAVKNASVDRTVKAKLLIKELGGEVEEMFAVLGDYDCIFIVKLPNVNLAMKASLGLNLLTGITFSSFPAVSIDDLDKIMGEL